MKISARPRCFCRSSEHVEDLRPDRGVEHRDRLVADQAVRLEHEGGRDRDPLALPAGELMGVAVEEALRVEADVVERPPHPLLALLGGDSLDPQRLVDDRRDALARVQGLVGVLEDHLHALAEGPLLALAGDDLPLEGDLAGRRLLQAEHRPRQGRLPATGLADDAEDLPRAPLQRDAVERPRRLPAARELDREVADLHQRRRRRRRRRRSCAHLLLGHGRHLDLRPLGPGGVMAGGALAGSDLAQLRIDVRQRSAL